MTAAIPKPLQHQTSRWQAGPSTFGPKGRLISTAITLIIPAWFGFLALYVGVVAILFGIPILVAWCGCIAPWILRDTWAKDAFHVPVPPIPPLHQMQTWDGQPIPTLADYVSGQSPAPDQFRR